MTGAIDRVLNHALLAFFALAALGPIVGVLLVALHPPDAPVTGFALPDALDLSSFRLAWREGGFGHSLQASAIIAGTTVLGSSVLSILAGYAFATMRFRGASALFYLVLFGLLMPFEATIVPLYYDFRGLGLTDTYWAVILPSTGLSIAFGIFWMRAFFLSAPRSLVEAARIDGASSLTVLLRILLPFGRPAVLTMVLLVFMWTWNDFLLSLVMLSGQNILTAPLSLAFFQASRETNIQLVAAGAIIVAAPVLAVYLVLQRQFIRGVVSGSVKA